MDGDPEHLGELLRQLRSRKGIGHPDEMAKLFGISSSYAYWLESGWSSPQPKLLGRMLEAYEATEDEALLAWKLRAVAPARPRGGSLKGALPAARAAAGAGDAGSDDDHDLTEETEPNALTSRANVA